MGRVVRAVLVTSLLASSGCLKLDMFLFNAEEATLEDYDFGSEALDGIDLDRITSEMIPVGDSGERIHVVFVEGDPSRLDPRIDRDAGVTVLFNHGNSRNILNYWHRVGYFEELGFNVLIYDYRGYGASDGETTEDNTYEDAAAAYDYAVSQECVGEVLSLGYSLGGGPAIWICSPESGREVFGCFTEAAFASTQAMTEASTGYDLPWAWLVNSEYDNASRAATVEVPFMIMHGIEDDFVGIQNGELIWERVRDRHPLNRFFAVEGAEHSTVPIPSHDEEAREYSYPDELPPDLREELRLYQARVVDFVADALAH